MSPGIFRKHAGRSIRGGDTSSVWLQSGVGGRRIEAVRRSIFRRACRSGGRSATGGGYPDTARSATRSRHKAGRNGGSLLLVHWPLLGCVAPWAAGGGGGGRAGLNR